MMYIDIIV